MAIEIFAGQGEVMIAKLDSDGNKIGGFISVGEAEQLSISTSVETQKYYENRSGLKKLAQRWRTQIDTSFMMDIKSFNAVNLVTVLQGSDSGSVTGTTVTSEDLVTTSPNIDATYYVAYPGITSVAVKNVGGTVTYTPDTDYIVDSRNGGIKIISNSNITAGDTLEIDYTHVGVSAVIKALQSSQDRYAIRFNGINMTNPDEPVIVECKLAVFDPAEELSLFSTEGVMLSVSGDLLIDSNEESYTVTLANSVA